MQLIHSGDGKHPRLSFQCTSVGISIVHLGILSLKDEGKAMCCKLELMPRTATIARLYLDVGLASKKVFDSTLLIMDGLRELIVLAMLFWSDDQCGKLLEKLTWNSRRAVQPMRVFKGSRMTWDEVN